MSKNHDIQPTGAAHNHPEVIIRTPNGEIIIDLEDLFNRKCDHPEHDPGEVIYYRIKVDGKTFDVKQHSMTGRELLQLVGKTPEKHRLHQLGHGQVEIEANDEVDFRTPGIERFQSVAKHANEGIGAASEAAPIVPPLRRAFELLPADAAYLDKQGYRWETLSEGMSGWVLIHNFVIPSGYNVKEATVAFLIPPTYPTTEIDMMYFYPELSRVDGRTINALSPHPLDGKNFQRWSRHRNPGDWHPGEDSLITHMLAVAGWLKSELGK
ncbi:multiubiquitin domain-containing protein [Hymenobacter sp. ASUV-10]|uniref:Multiubiquitin domain-containing protein n=1 Tax=Hymenobacter aranciens TaxID=3063996 RepID=A0ABT9B7P2_9BACT|nr:multiubiquitin domain-containing protein [Hymenobacter sp. ASUV-10]MDO7874235.1 multiubiquitin domain-containing protein [Hymenobacter sp. ASUV-10]